MDHSLRQDDIIDDDVLASEPLVRPFETVAIGCGIATLIGMFAVSHVLLKGALIGGSLVGLTVALLYFGFVGSRSGVVAPSDRQR
jgi:hypothetical protein